MARQTNPQDILAAARKRNEDRLGAIERIVGERGTRARITRAEEALAAAIAEHQRAVDAAKAEDAVAYADALKVWTATELRGVGIRPLDGARPAVARAAARSRSRRKPADGPSEAERQAADELTRLSEEMGTYDQPNPELAGTTA